MASLALVKQEQNASRPASVPANATSPAPQQRHPPTSDEIDAVIQMATSSRASPDGRPIPLKDTRTQLFAGNLPYRVRWQDLKDLFRKAGTVLRADVSLGPDNRSRGYGTVLLATAEDAGRAVDMFNGYSWQSRILEVRLDRLPQDLDNPPGSAPGYLSPAPPPPMRTMPYSMSPLPPSSILGQMPQIGPPLSLDDPYADYTMFGHDRPGTAGSVSRNLFVGNLPFHCQWQDLKDLFRQAGTILRADVALGQDGRSRGFGTVVFATELDAERAVKMFNGYEYNGRPLKVHFDKYTPTAPSSPVPTQAPPNVSATSFATMSTFAAQQQQQSSRLSSLLPQSFGFSPYDAASNPTSPSPFDAFQYPQRPVSPHTEMQHQLLARLTTSAAGLSSSVNASVLRDPTSSYAGHSSSSAKGLSELPTPPSSSSGQPSATSLRPRTPTPPLPAPPPPPSHSLSQPALSLRRPVAQNQVLSAPLLKGTGRQSSSAAAAAAISSVQLLQQQQQQQREQQQQQQQEQQQRQHQQQQQQRQQQFQQQQEQHRQQQEQQRQQQSYHSHPAHPGPISLPPPSAFPLPPPHTISPMSPVHQHPQISPMHHPMLPSPLHHPMHYYQHSPLHHPALSMTTPHGLPPITPSMPSFQFAPGSGIPFSPGPAMSPGAFWGRPGGGANPGINAAVGAPVRAGGDGGEDYFMGMGMGMSMSTMPSMPSVESGYFPPFGSVGGSGLANEILRGTEGSADDRAENLRTSLNGNGHREGTTKSRSRSRSRSAGPPSEKGSAPRGRGEREVDGVDGLIERMGGLGAAHPQPRVPPPDVFWSGGADDGDKPPAPAPALHRSGSDPVQQAQHEQGQARPLSTGTSAGGAAS